MSIDNKPKLKDGLKVKKDGELFFIECKGQTLPLYTLNESAFFILNEFDGKKNIEEILEKIVEKNSSFKREKVFNDIKKFIHDLKEIKLIE